MKTFIILPMIKEREIPEKFRNDDNRYPESLVKYFLKNYTNVGDKILDVFAGLGTTLLVAEEMKREAVGIEFNEARYNYIKPLLKNSEHFIHGDALLLDEYKLPLCDFCLTSPPYMPKSDSVNPFTNCETETSYEQYLEDIKTIFSKIKKIMKPNSYVVSEVSNLKINNELTTLAWDIGKAISEVLHFEGEIIVSWTSSKMYTEEPTYGYGYDHSYCLIYKNI
ncbi:MAG: DNA methyltransferase [Candidatus Heimdallarchaeota archaeon]